MLDTALDAGGKTKYSPLPLEDPRQLLTGKLESKARRNRSRNDWSHETICTQQDVQTHSQ